MEQLNREDTIKLLNDIFDGNARYINRNKGETK
jgi:hypothetical protein